MANRPPYPSPDDDREGAVDAGPTAGTPRWVKVSALIVLAVLVLFVVALLAGGHNPGRH
jgi:hypothetical protein